MGNRSFRDEQKAKEEVGMDSSAFAKRYPCAMVEEFRSSDEFKMR